MFDHIGYLKEYYIDNKFIGAINIDKIDRDVVGYEGKQSEVTKEKVVFKNGRKIKQNTSVVTIVYPLCGKETF